MDSPATASDRIPRPGMRLTRAVLSIDSYGPILASLLVTYVLACSLTGESERAIVLFAQIGTVWLVFRVSGSRPVVRRTTDVLLVLAGITAITNLAGETDGIAVNALFAANCVLYVIAPIAIVRHVATRTVVDLETILAAIAAYLLIGMLFAFAYRWLGHIQTDPLFGLQGSGTMAQCLFFSFTTLLTIGYGNLVPFGTTGQTMAVAEGLIGSLFLIVMLAKAVSAWRPKAIGDPEGDPVTDRDSSSARLFSGAAIGAPGFEPGISCPQSGALPGFATPRGRRQSRPPERRTTLPARRPGSPPRGSAASSRGA